MPGPSMEDDLQIARPFILSEVAMFAAGIHTFWPLIVIVVSNVFYNIISKSIPENASPWAVLVVSYLVAAFLSLVAYFIFETGKNFVSSVQDINWTGVALGLSMVGLEIGYIFIYRTGWKISVASLLTNILLAVILLLIGVLVYKEQLNAKQLVGMLLCITGCVFLMSQK